MPLKHLLMMCFDLSGRSCLQNPRKSAVDSSLLPLILRGDYLKESLQELDVSPMFFMSPEITLNESILTFSTFYSLKYALSSSGMHLKSFKMMNGSRLACINKFYFYYQPLWCQT